MGHLLRVSNVCDETSHETYTCATVSSSLIRSTCDPSLLVNHAGPSLSPANSWLPATSALLPPLLSQSSALGPLAGVSPSANDVPVLLLYPHPSRPLCFSASS